ncbi:MAG: hypothetical protein LBD62_05475 [Candidatus Margulisbacteria bacterium]|jgi:hypothetical protein|nr:hypothetical protein [Candidatus Margulisiibacteriota bacterium]
MLRVLIFLLATATAAEEAAAPLYVSSSGIYLRSLLKSLAIIILLLIFTYYWYKYLLPRVNGGRISPEANLVLKERLVIEPGTTAYVLEIKGAHKLLLVSNKQTACYDLPAGKLQYSAPLKKDFAAYLADFASRKNVLKSAKITQPGKKHVKK